MRMKWRTSSTTPQPRRAMRRSGPWASPRWESSACPSPPGSAAREVSGPATFALFFGLVVAWFLQQSSHRPQESACDRRAAELCGDPETLVRALGRLHAMALMPRRLAPEDEVSTSHPSLASRVAAIRSASPPAAAATSAPVVLVTARPGTFVILEPERISWLEGVGAGVDASDPAALRAAAREVAADPYAEFTELLLKACGKAIELHARTLSGVRRAHVLAPGSVATAQQALNLAEGRLASVAPLPGGRGHLCRPPRAAGGVLGRRTQPRAAGPVRALPPTRTDPDGPGDDPRRRHPPVGTGGVRLPLPRVRRLPRGPVRRRLPLGCSARPERRSARHRLRLARGGDTALRPARCPRFGGAASDLRALALPTPPARTLTSIGIAACLRVRGSASGGHAREALVCGAAPRWHCVAGRSDARVAAPLRPGPLLDEARSSPSAATREVQAQVVCAVGDERRARVWAFDPAAGARRAFGSLAIRSPRVAIGPEFAVLVCRDHKTPTDEAGPKTALLIRLPVSRTEKH